jgi:hypothetical protein
MTFVPYDGMCAAQDGDGWCTRYSGDYRGTPGRDARLAFDACNTELKTAELRFESFPVNFYLDVSYSVVDGVVLLENDSQWMWSWGRPRPGPSSVSVAARSCARWSVIWNVTLNDGTHPEPGTHRVMAFFFEEDAGQGLPAENVFEIQAP